MHQKPSNSSPCIQNKSLGLIPAWPGVLRRLCLGPLIFKPMSALDLQIPGKEGFSSSLQHICLQLPISGSPCMFFSSHGGPILLDVQDLKTEPFAQPYLSWWLAERQAELSNQPQSCSSAVKEGTHCSNSAVYPDAMRTMSQDEVGLKLEVYINLLLHPYSNGRVHIQLSGVQLARRRMRAHLCERFWGHLSLQLAAGARRYLLRSPTRPAAPILLCQNSTTVKSC